MGILNQDTIDAASATFQAKFDEIFANGEAGVYQAFTDTIPTSSKVNEIDVLESMPVVRKWEGEKRYQSIRASKLSATVIKYEKSFEIDRLDFASDKTGAIGRRISAFMSDAALYDKIVHDVLVSASGAGPTGYDGVALFSASHPRVAGSTGSNLTTTALSFAQFDTVMVAGASLRDDEGEPLRISYDTLIVGPKLMKLAMEITQSNVRLQAVANDGLEAGTRVAAAAIPNVWGPGSMVFGGGQMTLIVDPRLVGTYDDYYYFLDTKKGPKPLHLFEFRKPEVIEQTSMDGHTRFNTDKFRWSIEFDAVCTAGAWQTAYAGVL